MTDEIALRLNRLPLRNLLRGVVALVLVSGSAVSTDFAAAPPDPLPLSRRVAAGAAHSLAIDPSGAVFAWGQNLTGQLGTGDRQPRMIPTRVSGLTGTFVSVASGLGHSLALRNDGALFAWGLNLEGQLGVGSNATRLTPVQITTLSNVVAIGAGAAHSLAVTSDGSAWAWGGNVFGQIGDGSATQRRSPVRITTLSNIVSVEAGATHSLALRGDGKVLSWGANLAGQLGDSTSTLRRRPVEVLSVTGAISIAAGSAHNVAVTQGGAVWAWGLNSAGQLGDGTTTTRRTPVLLSGLPTIVAASAGAAHSVAITTTGAALGWGDNSSGQIGDGSTTRRLTPVPVMQPPTPVIAMAAGGAHTVAVDGDAAVWAWGNNVLAQLGDGTRQSRNAPAPISGPNATWGVYPPLFTPEGGTFTDSVSVTLSTPTPNAVIHYSIDGSDPAQTQPVYASPIPISSTTTVKARAFRAGMAPSTVSTATYTISGGTLATPVATPAGGTFAHAQSVTLSADSGAAIRYTLDGNEPTLSSDLYGGPIAIAASAMLKARALKAGFNPSEILTEQYVIETPVPQGEDPPPDPVTVAPPISEVVLTDFSDAQAFLFAGEDPIQRDHTPGSIASHAMTVVRGRVLARDGEPLVGVRITPKDQPAVGHTVSRADGLFDLAVNGGAGVTIQYTRAGYLPSQRIVETRWNDFVWAPDVRLVTLDPVVTTVSMGPRAEPEVARGGVITDSDGTRRATVIVPEGGVANIHLQDGTQLSAVSQLSIRATEYTVGSGGREAMPGDLPATSGYTYAVEWTADEVLAAQGTSVTFDPPLVSYLENFLDFPVGGIVPTGYYDREQSAWVASTNGRIVRILGVDAAGQAELDLDGSGQPAGSTALGALGITAGERRRLGTLYAPGQSLWRTPIAHFTAWDHNWPFGPPDGSRGPGINPRQERQGDKRRTGLTSDPNGSVTDSCIGAGSIIECENQTLGETLPIAGTPHSLSYRSSRVAGGDASRVLIPIAEHDLPASLSRIEVTTYIGGQREFHVFPPLPDQSTTLIWNGLDGYGRRLAGAQLAMVKVTYVYPGVYRTPAGSMNLSFGNPGTTTITGDRDRSEIYLSQTFFYELESAGPGRTAVAGWDVDVHHRFDPKTQTVFLGSGGQINGGALGSVLRTTAGGGTAPVTESAVDGRLVKLQSPLGSIAALPSGGFAFSDASGILIQDHAGLVRRLSNFTAGNVRPSLATNRDGDILFSSAVVEGSCGEGETYSTVRINRLTVAGLLSAVAQLTLASPLDCGTGTLVAIGSDDALFVAAGGELYRKNPRAQDFSLINRFEDNAIAALAADRRGGVYIGLSGQIVRWNADGAIVPVAGPGDSSLSGDGGPAIEAGVGTPRAMAVDAIGTLYFVNNTGSPARIRAVTADGLMLTHAGHGQDFDAQRNADGKLASAARLREITGLAMAPNGDLYFTEDGPPDNPGGEENDCGDEPAQPVDALALVRMLAPAISRGNGSLGSTFVPSTDGGVLFEFDPRGQHLRTIDSLTGVVLTSFGHDADGRLTFIEDRDGLRTIVNRSGGVPTSIVSPFGVTTTLTVDGGYLTGVTDAEGNGVGMSYSSTGLLTSFTDANGHVSTFEYNSIGRLVRDQGPAGADQTLDRTELGDGWDVVRAIADAGTTVHRSEQLPAGGQRRTVTRPDGTVSESVNNGEGSTSLLAPDGTLTTVTLASDPRFGTASSFARESTITTPAGTAMSIVKSRAVTLADPNNALSVTTATDTTTVNGATSTTVFDAAAKTIASTSPEGRQTVTTLDAKGRPVRVEVGTLVPTTFTYDASGRLASQTQGSRSTTFTYDAHGYVETVTDPLDRTVTFANDRIGRRTRQTFPDARFALFGYDGNSNLTSLTPPGRPEHAMTYTGANLLEQYTAPAAPTTSVTQYEFNRAQQPTTVTRADAQQITWSYDDAGRPTTLTTPTGVTTYGYSPTTGQLTSLTSPSGGLAYSYDGSLQTAETFSGAVSGAVTWDYDAFFRVSAERIRGANQIAFQYDNDGLLTRAGALTYSRDAATGLLTNANLGSTLSSFAYNDFGELIQEETRRSTTILYRGVYTRDAGGRLETRTETIGGATGVDAYTYDLAGRLAAVSRDGNLLASYGYDANGNRTSVTTTAGTIAATYDAQDRILTFGDRTYTHTHHGEVQSWTDSAGTTTLSYDVQGNLLAVGLPSGTTVEYLVDGRNRRIGRKVNGAVTHGWLYQEQLRPVAELNASGAIVSRFVYGARAVAPEYMIRGGVTYRFVTDQLGSVRLVVNNSTGVIVQRLDYDAWGQVINDTNPGFQPFGYAGGILDPQTRLVRFGVRDYPSDIGRWLSKDPIRFDGADANLYAYSGNEPTNRIDFEGTEWIDTTLKVVSDASAGFGDTLTSGLGLTHLVGLPSLTEAVRESVGLNDVVDFCSSAYFAGKAGAWAWAISFNAVGYAQGAEFWIGKNFRVAPWGNRTGHATGKFPHYHRKITGPSGETVPGGSMRWHRPYEKGW
jgi:RHS repeat-associated protein